MAGEPYVIGQGYVSRDQQTPGQTQTRPQRTRGMAPSGAGQVVSDDPLIDALQRPGAWKSYLLHLSPWSALKRELSRLVVTPQEWLDDPGQAFTDIVGTSLWPMGPSGRSLVQGVHDTIEAIGRRRETGEFGQALPVEFWRGYGEGMPELLKTSHGYPLLRGIDAFGNILANRISGAPDMSVDEILRRTLFPEVFGEPNATMFNIGYDWIVPGDPDNYSWMRRAAGSATGMGLSLATDPLILGPSIFSVAGGTARTVVGAADRAAYSGMRQTFAHTVDEATARTASNAVRQSVAEAMSGVSGVNGGRGINPRWVALGTDTAMEPLREAISRSLAPLRPKIGPAGVQGMTELTLREMQADAAVQLRARGRPVRSLLRQPEPVAMYAEGPGAGYQQLVYEFGTEDAGRIWERFTQDPRPATLEPLIEATVQGADARAIRRVTTATERGLASQVTPIGPEDIFARHVGLPFGETEVPGLIRGLHRRAGRLTPTTRAVREMQAIEIGAESHVTYESRGRPSAAQQAFGGELSIEEIIDASRPRLSPEGNVRYYQNQPHSHRVSNAIELGQGGVVTVAAEDFTAYTNRLAQIEMVDVVKQQAILASMNAELAAELAVNDEVRRQVGLPTVTEVSPTISEARTQTADALRTLLRSTAPAVAAQETPEQAPEAPLLRPVAGEPVEEAASPEDLYAQAEAAHAEYQAADQALEDMKGTDVSDEVAKAAFNRLEAASAALDERWQAYREAVPEEGVQAPEVDPAVMAQAETAYQDLRGAVKASMEGAPVEEIAAAAEIAANAGMQSQDILTTVDTAISDAALPEEEAVAVREGIVQAIAPVIRALKAAEVIEPNADEPFAALNNLSPEDQAELARLGDPDLENVDWQQLAGQRWEVAKSYLSGLRDAAADAENRRAQATSGEEEAQWTQLRAQLRDAIRGRTGTRKTRQQATERQRREIDKRLEAARDDGLGPWGLWRILADYFGGSPEARLVEFIEAVADEQSGAGPTDISLPNTPIFLRRDEMQKLWYWRELSLDEQKAHLSAISDWAEETPLSQSPLRDLAVRLRWSMEQRSSPQAPAEATASQLEHVRDTIIADIQAVQGGLVPSDIAEANLDRLREMYAPEVQVFDAVEQAENPDEFVEKIRMAYDQAIARAEGRPDSVSETGRMAQVVAQRGLHHRQQADRAAELAEHRWEALRAYNMAVNEQPPAHWRAQVPLDDPVNRGVAQASAEAAFLMRQGRDTEVHALKMAREIIVNAIERMGDDWRILLEPNGFGIETFFPSLAETGMDLPACRSHAPFKDADEAKAWVREQYKGALEAAMTDEDIARLTHVTADEVVPPRRLEVPAEAATEAPEPQGAVSSEETTSTPTETSQEATTPSTAPSEPSDRDKLVEQMNAVHNQLDRMRQGAIRGTSEEQADLAKQLADLEAEYYRPPAEVADQELRDAILEVVNRAPLDADRINFEASKIVAVRPHQLMAKTNAMLLMLTIQQVVDKQGAIFTGPDYVPEENQAGPQGPVKEEFARDATPEEKITAVLQTGSVTIDELAARTGIPMEQLEGELLSLTIEEKVQQSGDMIRLPGNRLQRDRPDLEADVDDFRTLAEKLIADRIALNELEERRRMEEDYTQYVEDLQSGEPAKQRAAMIAHGVNVSQAEAIADQTLKSQSLSARISHWLSPDRWKRFPGWHPAHSEAFRNGIAGAQNWTSTWASDARRAIEHLDARQEIALTWYMSMATARADRTNLFAIRPGQKLVFTVADQAETVMRILNIDGDPADYVQNGKIVGLPKHGQEVIEAGAVLAKLYDKIYHGDVEFGYPSLSEISAELAEMTGDKSMAWQPGYIGNTTVPDPRMFEETLRRAGFDQASIEQAAKLTNPASGMYKFVEQMHRALNIEDPAKQREAIIAAREGLPVARASQLIDRYAGNINYMLTRRTIYKLVTEYFHKAEDIEKIVGAEQMQDMRDNGWGTVRSGSKALEGLEDYLLPPAVRRLLEAKYLSTTASEQMNALAILLDIGKQFFRPVQVVLLKSIAFVVAQLIEQGINWWTEGIMTHRWGRTFVRAMALNNRVLMQGLLEEHERVPYRRAADRLKVALARAHEAVWTHLGSENDPKLIRQFIREARDYGLYSTSFSVAGRNELEKVAEAFAEQFKFQKGIASAAREAAAIDELFSTLWFGLDSIGRGTAYIAQRLMGESAEEARRIVRDHTVEYMEDAMSDMGGVISKTFWYWTYLIERAHQFPTMVGRFPYIGITLAEARRKMEEYAGWDTEMLAYLTGKPPWMKTAMEYIALPYKSYWLKDIRRGSKPQEYGGSRIVFVRIRLPHWEEAGQYMEWFARPYSTATESMIPIVQWLEAGEKYADLEHTLRALPILGARLSMDRRVRLAQQLPLSARARLDALGLGPNPMTYEEAQHLYDIGQVPQWCQARNDEGNRYGPKVPEKDREQYEIEMMLFYSDLFYASSKYGLTLYPVKLDDMINNMTLRELKRARRAAGLKVENGQKPFRALERLDEEIEQREEGVGPQTWFDQTLAIQRGAAAEVIPLLTPAVSRTTDSSAAAQ